jgi:hypothetical protein
MITIIALFGVSTIMSQAQAECNIDLPYQELVDCIVVEGAGAKYKGEKELDFPVSTKTETDKSDTSNEIASKN